MTGNNERGHKRKPKIAEADLVAFLATRPNVLETYHGGERVLERALHMSDVRRILWGELPRQREPSRDRWDESVRDWSYVVRGTNSDGQKMRIVFAVDNGVLLITAYVLDR